MIGVAPATHTLVLWGILCLGAVVALALGVLFYHAHTAHKSFHRKLDKIIQHFEGK